MLQQRIHDRGPEILLELASLSIQRGLYTIAEIKLEYTEFLSRLQFAVCINRWSFLISSGVQMSEGGVICLIR